MFSWTIVKRVQQLARCCSEVWRQTLSASSCLAYGPQIRPLPSVKESNSSERNSPPITQYRVLHIALSLYSAAAGQAGFSNCAFSVDSDSAVVEEFPPLIVSFTRSK
jgi:hypothetical protein